MEWERVFRFVLASLAAWRLAFLVVREHGPYQTFERARKWAGEGFVGQLVSCVKCVGVWIAVPFALFVGGTNVELLVTWLAIAGVVALIDEVTKPPFEWQPETIDELLPERTTDGADD